MAHLEFIGKLVITFVFVISEMFLLALMSAVIKLDGSVLYLVTECGQKSIV